MKLIYMYVAGAMLLLSSCSSQYKASQTPDDVYYSPGGQKGGYTSGSNSNRDEYYSATSSNDQYIRLKTQDQARWSYFDDFNYADSYYAPSGIGTYYGYGSYGSPYFSMGLGYGLWDPYSSWNSYYLWNSYYNPYFYNPYYGGGAIIVNNKYPSGATGYTRLRAFSPTSYRAATSSNAGGRYYTPGNGNIRPSSSNSGSNSGRFGNSVRSVFSGSNNGNNSYRPAGSSNSTFSQPTRSYTPSSSPSSSGRSAGGGGGGGFSRPGRN